MPQEPRDVNIMTRPCFWEIFAKNVFSEMTSEMVKFIQAIYPIYKQMKESSKASISSSFQLLLQNSLESSKTRKINSIIRRGYAPTASPSNRQQSMSNDHPWLSDTAEQASSSIKSIPSGTTAQYPWTAFGVVALAAMGRVRYLGTGTIIGEKFILTARFLQLYEGCEERGDLFFIPFFRRDPNERYVVQKVFPPHKPQNIPEGQHSSTSELKFAILQLNISSQIEQKYGSIGYNFNYFQNNPHPRLFIAGMNKQEEDSNHLILAKGRIEVREQQIEFEQTFEWRCGRGSPFLYTSYGELFVCGVQVDSEGAGYKRGVKFNKEIYLYNLGKFTFQGYELDLSQNILRDRQINYLKEVSLKKAVAIDLEATQIGALGLKALNRGRVYNQLEQINLNNNKLTDDCIECIHSAPWKNLTSLFVSNNKLTSRGMRLLCANSWKNLSRLQLNNNPLGTKGIQHLVKSDWLLLQILNLQSTQIDDYGCQKLRKGRFPALLQLTLRKNRIQSEGVKWLLQADWQHLKYVDLGKNRLREEGLKALLKANWTKLHILRLEMNQIRFHIAGSKTKFRSKFKDIIFV